MVLLKYGLNTERVSKFLIVNNVINDQLYTIQLVYYMDKRRCSVWLGDVTVDVEVARRHWKCHLQAIQVLRQHNLATQPGVFL